MKNPPYVLGHSAFELERLARQERLIGKMTREYFANAGIGPGKRVLDVGSGTGAVAFHAAELVGRSGEVIGTDLAPEAVATANKNAAALGLSHVSFRQGNPVEMSFDQPFDAIVGRYVLLFQADQSEMLRRLAKLLKPRGIIVFHEPDWSFVRSDPVAPVYDRCCAWITDTFAAVGTNSNMSGKLRHAFLGAGLPPPTMQMQAVIGDAVSAAEWLRAVAELAIVLAPTMERQGIASSHRYRLRNARRALDGRRFQKPQYYHRSRRDRCMGPDWCLSCWALAAHQTSAEKFAWAEISHPPATRRNTESRGAIPLTSFPWTVWSVSKLYRTTITSALPVLTMLLNFGRTRCCGRFFR